MVTPTPGGTLNAPVLAAAALAGVDRIVRVGGAQAIGALAFGTATVPRGRQDRRTRQRLRRGGQAARVRPRRHRHGGGSLRGAGDRRCQRATPTGSPWTSSRRPSTTRSRRRSCSTPDAGLARPRGALHGAAAGRRCRGARSSRPRSPRAARSSRCATSPRPPRSPTASRPSTSSWRWPTPRRCCRRSATPAPIFLGHYASESLGDYCAGPNHVLPTSRTARFSSPLGVYDFQKRTSLIAVSRDSARRLGRVAATLARAEGLEAHARSAELRIEE